MDRKMLDRRMFDTPVLPRLETILAEVSSGDLVIPDFQRPFVWDDDRRVSLLDSIVKGMPIGSLLVWRTTNRDLHTYDQIGGIRLAGPRKSDEKINYLIDGHQRISTLFGALYSGERERADDDEVRWPLYYKLGAEDRPAFGVRPRRGAVPDHWLPLDILLDGDKLFDFTQHLRQSGRRDLAKEAERLSNIFRDYIIPIVPLVTEELNVVTDAFVRINSQGKGMSEAHMLRALTHLSAVDTDAYFRKVRARLEPLGWGTLDDQVLVNVLKSQLDLDVYASDVRGVHERLKTNPKPLEGLADVLEEAVGLLATVGVQGPGALPYAYQLVTLATLAARFPGSLREPEIHRQLRSWFWITTYTEHFTGITGNRIRDGIHELTEALGKEIMNAGSGLEIIPAGKKSGVSGTPLLNLTRRLNRFRSVLTELDGRCDARFVAALLRSSGLGREELRQREKVDEAASQLRTYLERRHPDLFPLQIKIRWESEHGVGRLEIIPRAGSQARPSVIDWVLIDSPEYQEAWSIDQDLRSIGAAPYVARAGESEETIENGEALIEYLDKRNCIRIIAERHLAPISPLTQFRMSTVRARAFLLFLAQLPRDEEARRRRQERLGTGDTGVAPSLLSTGSGSEPGNRVIAAPAELRELRAAVRNGQIEKGMADEFGIPPEAAEALPAHRAFLDARGRWLVDQEEAFIESFGLTVSDRK